MSADHLAHLFALPALRGPGGVGMKSGRPNLKYYLGLPDSVRPRLLLKIRFKHRGSLQPCTRGSDSDRKGLPPKTEIGHPSGHPGWEIMCMANVYYHSSLSDSDRLGLVVDTVQTPAS